MENKERFADKIRRYRKWKPWVEMKELLVIAIGCAPFAIAVNRLLIPHAIVGTFIPFIALNKASNKNITVQY